jgi:hypothetical protein
VKTKRIEWGLNMRFVWSFWRVLAGVKGLEGGCAWLKVLVEGGWYFFGSFDILVNKKEVNNLNHRKDKK